MKSFLSILSGWLLPHYAIPSVAEAWLRDHPVPAPGAAGVQP